MGGQMYHLSWAFAVGTCPQDTFSHCPAHLFSGIDVERFAQDPEYKEETILGLAM